MTGFERPELKVTVDYSDVVVEPDGASMVTHFNITQNVEVTLPNPEDPEGAPITVSGGTNTSLECTWEKVGGEWKVTKAAIHVDLFGVSIIL